MEMVEENWKILRAKKDQKWVKNEIWWKEKGIEEERIIDKYDFDYEDVVLCN